eukprot:Skav230387  [mRNA]  locus=scaffold62:310235:314837:- [translate_table: standard]
MVKPRKAMLGISGRQVGVPIYVEDASSGDDRLFHEWKLNKEAQLADAPGKSMKNGLQDMEEGRGTDGHSTQNRVYERLQEPKLASDDEWRRLLAAKDVDTQVLIDAWRISVLIDAWTTQQMLAEPPSQCWFGDAKGEYSRYLGHKIWRHLDERAKDLCHQRFVQFSCHDTTMCALAAHFGLELKKIGFGAFFALELHENQGSHFVKFYYNEEPDLGATELQVLGMPIAAISNASLRHHPMKV